MNFFFFSDYSVIRFRVDEVFFLRRFTVKVIGEIEFIVTFIVAIVSGMGVVVLFESVARSLCGVVNGWMLRIIIFFMSFFLLLNLFVRANLSL